MVVLRSGRQAAAKKTSRRAFEDLISEIGQDTAISKPRYADSKKLGNDLAWRKWASFCQRLFNESELITSPDAVVVYKEHLSHAVVRAYLWSVCENGRFCSSSSLFTFAKAWRMAVIENLQLPVRPDIKLDMKNYIMDVLIPEFGLKQLVRFKGNMNSDDVLAVLHHHWVLCDDWYPEERQRVQHAGMNIFCASTTARAGSVVELSGYHGTNDAVQYRDVQLFVVQDERHPRGVKVGMLCQLRLLKGRRNQGSPPIIKFAERRDVPSFCLVKLIIGLTFKDRAFASPRIKTPEDIYNIQIPDRLQAVPIEFSDEWLQIPIFRRTVRDKSGKIFTSPVLASQYNQMSTWNRRLGRSFGMKERFEFKMLRRAAAAVLTSKSFCTSLSAASMSNWTAESAPEGVRNQAMGHSNSAIHDRYYQNQIFDADTVSAFLDTPSDEGMMRLMGHMSLTRDSAAPSKPSAAQCEQARNDAEVLNSKIELQRITQEFRDRYGPITAARRKGKENRDTAIAVEALDRTRRDHDKLYQRKLTDLFEASRQEYFDTLGVVCLENQHAGHKEPVGPTQPAYRFSERAELAKLLFPTKSSEPPLYTEQVQTSCRIIELYTALCGRREAPRTRQERIRSASDLVEAEAKPCFLDTDPDIYPMQCPGMQCLFCLGDVTLTSVIRTRCFSKPYTLTRHVHNQHLRFYATGESFICPHPSCTIDGVVLQGPDHFKAHALREHNIAHCV